MRTRSSNIQFAYALVVLAVACASDSRPTSTTNPDAPSTLDSADPRGCTSAEDCAAGELCFPTTEGLRCRSFADVQRERASARAASHVLASEPTSSAQASPSASLDAAATQPSGAMHDREVLGPPPPQGLLEGMGRFQRGGTR